MMYYSMHSYKTDFNLKYASVKSLVTYEKCVTFNQSFDSLLSIKVQKNN